MKDGVAFNGGELDWLIRPFGLTRIIATIRFVGDIKPTPS